VNKLLETQEYRSTDWGLFDSFRQSEQATKLFGRTMEHAELSSLITWVPTAWLLDYANPSPQPQTNMAGADGLPDHQVDMDSLFQSMLDQGMRDPLIIGIGLNGRVRLESGNQRIGCFIENGVDFVPVVGFVNDTAITHEANGLHQGLPLDIDIAFLLEHYQQHARLSDAVYNAPVFTD
jgi:hypothetical protein